MIKKKDTTLTEGYLVPIKKPGKDAKDPASFRPINLLSSYRKLLSTIILSRINNRFEETMSTSQFAYRAGKSTGDIVLAHKYLIAGAKTKGINKVCA